MDWKVDIYIKTDTKYLGNKKRGIGYVIGTMIGKELKTIEFFGSVEETLPGTYLTTINAALRRMTKPADIVIHAESPFVANMFTSYMAQWAAGGMGKPHKEQKGVAGAVRTQPTPPHHHRHRASCLQPLYADAHESPGD